MLSSPQASDHTGMQWITAFGDSAEPIFGGVKAPDLLELEERDNSEAEKTLIVSESG